MKLSIVIIVFKWLVGLALICPVLVICYRGVEKEGVLFFMFVLNDKEQNMYHTCKTAQHCLRLVSQCLMQFSLVNEPVVILGMVMHWIARTSYKVCIHSCMALDFFVVLMCKVYLYLYSVRVIVRIIKDKPAKNKRERLKEKEVLQSIKLSTTNSGNSDIHKQEHARHMFRIGSISTTAICVTLITLVATVASMTSIFIIMLHFPCKQTSVSKYAMATNRL